MARQCPRLAGVPHRHLPQGGLGPLDQHQLQQYGPMGRACAVYTGIASCCPQLQSLTLNLEGGLDGWTGVDLLPRCLTSLSLATRHCEAKLPLRLFNVFLQLQHLHLTLDCTETCGIAIITGVLHLPHLQILQVTGSKDGAIYLPGFKRSSIPATCAVRISACARPQYYKEAHKRGKASHNAAALALLESGQTSSHTEGP